MVKPEHIAKLDLDRMMAIYRQRFPVLRDIPSSLWGSFEPEKLKPLVETYGQFADAGLETRSD